MMLEHRFRWLPALLLAAAVIFNLVGLYPEVSINAPYLNDNVLHYSLVERTVDAVDRGEDPTDFWVSTFDEGYPLFHHYQHLPHVTIALLFKALGEAVPLLALFHWINYLILATFPLSIYWAGKRLGFASLPVAIAGLLASLIATNSLYGLDYNSYIWRGYGMTTQLWGMWLLAPALAYYYITIRHGRAYLGTSILLGATMLSHTIFGYVAISSGLLMMLVGGWIQILKRAGRLAIVLLLVAGITSYFWVPFVVDHEYMNRSIWEYAGKYDAYGWEWTLKTLLSGNLLDSGRFPSLTMLLGVGVIFAIKRWRQDERIRLILAFFIFWLFLYFGRPTWGVLINLLPLSQDLPLHRLIAPVHLAAIGLAGCGLAWLLSWACRQRKLWLSIVMVILLMALLVPVYIERGSYLRVNAQWMSENASAYRDDGGALKTIFDDLKQLPPGRVYAGRAVNWGNSYKIGSVPVYALLPVNQFDNPGYLYHALSLNADIEGYLDETRPALTNLFNIRYIVAPQDLVPSSNWVLLATSGVHRLYELPTSGYFDLVDSNLILYGPKSAWFPAIQTWLFSNLVEQHQHPRVLLTENKAVPGGSGISLNMISFNDAPEVLTSLSLPVQGSCGFINNETVAGNIYRVEFKTGSECWLMLKETFHPGWKVTLDGASVTPEMLAPSFIGIEVQPGQHVAEFRYSSAPMRTWLIVGGLLLIGIAAFLGWTRKLWMSRVSNYISRVQTWGTKVEVFWEKLGVVLSQNIELKYILFLLVIILLAGLPLLQFKQIQGHDALEYLPRAEEFYKELQAGHLLPRWAPDFDSGYGQPFFIFNPPLIYYVISIFHFLGANFITSICLTNLLLLLIGGLGIYFWTREYFGRTAGLVACTAYAFAPYLLVNLYVRFAMADFSAMAFMPWALYGLAKWTRRNPLQVRNRGYLVMVAVATALIMLSSNPLALIFLPALLLYVLFLAWREWSWNALLSGGLALGLGLGLSAFFWLPALIERNLVQIQKLLIGYFNYSNHFVYLHQLIIPYWGYGLSVAGSSDGMSFNLGVVQMVLLVVAILLARYLQKRRAVLPEGWYHMWFFIAILALVVFLITDNSIWIWDRLTLLQYLEFPWRALSLAAIVLAFISAFPFSIIQEEKMRNRWAAVVIGCFLVIGMYQAKPEGYYGVTDFDYSPQVISSQRLAVSTANEYQPIWVQKQPDQPAPDNHLLVIEGQVRELSSRMNSDRYKWNLEANGSARLRIATFYYPGWKVYIDNQPREVQITNPYGMMDILLDSGVHKIVATFEETTLRSAAIWISIAILGILIAILLIPRKRKH